ncbi:MAG: HD domain-containing protein [Candidatus Levybacteria bacterium]|nr:HD domain-containing protein [Candidatus Levybacteria bacterium]
MTAEQVVVKDSIDVEMVASSLKMQLHRLSHELISNNLDLTIPGNFAFYNNPDNPSQHQPAWHQWGVITHIFMFEKYYREAVPSMLDSWGVGDAARDHFSEEVGGVGIRLAVLLHDIGKFSTRRFKKDDQSRWNFVGHERESGRIIREGEARAILEEHGLTQDQVEYVARCAELHFELGIVRNRAKISKSGYSLEFARSEKLAKICRQIQSKYPGFKWEIGVLFLADSLAKTDETVEADDDREITGQKETVKARLEKRGLRPELATAVLQQPINMKVAEVYLKSVAEDTTETT